MGRELRRVPAGWEHPKDDLGEYIPLHQYFPYIEEELDEGLRDGWLKNEPPYYGTRCMPCWSTSERTHYQYYENTSEGTPVSPVMPSLEALADWLTEHDDRRRGTPTEGWLNQLRDMDRGRRIPPRHNPKSWIEGFNAGLAAAAEKVRAAGDPHLEKVIGKLGRTP